MAAAALIPHTDIAGMLRPAGSLVGEPLSPYRGPWSSRLAAHLLRRAGFGGTQAEIARFASMSMHDGVDSLIDLPAADTIAPPPHLYDPREEIAQIIALRGLKDSADDTRRREIFKTVFKRTRRSIVAMQNWWLNRMLNTSAPLQEKMAFYFHGHFTTASVQKGVSAEMTYRQNQLFRSNALGNLRELTWQVSTDPAMLLYLDNAENVAKHPNENYARELMELFTLGVDHYTEEDVRQSARAWTGWFVNRRLGKAMFLPRRHDDGVKTFLGRTGNWSGRDVVEIIFEQPACAEFFASNLLNHFLYNNPEPELITAFAALIRKNDYDLRPVMSTLFRSNVFYSQRAYRALVKSPVEFVVGTYKTLGLPKIDLRAQRALMQMGQILFYPPNVAGWPGGENWLTSQTVIVRENFVAELVNSPALDGSWLEQIPVQTQQAVAQLVERILGGDASAAARAQLAGYLDGVNTSALGMLSGENYQQRMRGAAYLTMAMPAYQLS